MTSRRGQSTVEYLMTIAVLSIAIAAVIQVLTVTVANQTTALGKSLASSLSSDGVQR